MAGTELSETELIQDAQILGVIKRSSDLGEHVARSELQAELAIGAGDLQASLDRLIAAGDVSEDAPDMLAVASEPPRSALPAGTLVNLTPVAASPVLRGFAGGEARETVLSSAMIASLEDQALGALVKAGVAGAQGAAFVLRIEG